MKTNVYNSYIQLLPRETMEDVVNLINTDPHTDPKSGISYLGHKFLTINEYCNNIIKWEYKWGYYCGNKTVEGNLFSNICCG